MAESLVYLIFNTRYEMKTRPVMTLITLTWLLTFTVQVLADDLPRRANWEARFQFPEAGTAGMIIRALESNTPLA